MRSDENKINRLASELAQSVYETLGKSCNIQRVLREIEQEGYHIKIILSAAIGSSREKLSPYLIKEILLSKHLEKSNIQTEYSEQDICFLKSLKIQIAKETPE